MGHKIIDYLKYSDMQNMFENKGVKIAKKPYVVELKVVNPSIHMVDVNIAITRSNHSYDILGARMLWKPKEARILKNFIDQPV
jgi:hypothetical protein